ncbi:MAG: GH3 auxin-responsive promoter family protein [Phycisphaerales bacterium]|nr:GH3 auxin-responsive promoter family protein [Phycisphaerales bacterium]
MTGRATAQRFDRAAREPETAQQRLLTSILQRNRNTEYGRAHSFSSINTLQDYGQAVPIVTYEDIRDHIDRMTRGEPNILTAEAPLMFARTSGTTGNPKYIPVTRTCQRRGHRDQMRTWLYYALRDHPHIFDAKAVSLVSPAVEGYTPSGIPYGSTSGAMYRDMPRIVRSTYAIPYPVFEIEDYQQKYYCLLRVAIANSVTLLATANPSSVVTLCELAEQHADDLLRDLADGTLRDEDQLPQHARDALRASCKPAPERAHELEQARSRRGGRLLPADYWPDLALIACWKGGTVGHYLKRFAEFFDPDDSKPVPVRDWGYLSSEARGSIPISDEGDGGCLTVASNVYEFVPVDQVEDDGDDPTRWHVLGAHELEDHGQYYIIITTTGGLYRYDINDVVRVVGRHHNTPIISFARKGRGVTNITGEKVSVEQVIEAFERSGKSLGIQIPHFKAEARVTESRYAFKVEVDRSAPRQGSLPQLLEALDQELAELNLEYASKRRSLRLKPPVLQVMKPGWYEQSKSAGLRDNRRLFQAKTILLSDRHDDHDDSFVSQTIELDGEQPVTGKSAKKPGTQRP